MLLTKERLQKYMAHAGVASRRKSEKIIKQGRVKVNGETITQMGYKIDKDDLVEVDGKLIESKEKRVYYAINKPTNYITTTDEQFNRPMVLDLIQVPQRIYPVGRLDYDSSGLLLLTNDGELTNILIHPSYEIWKSYVVEVDDYIKDSDLKKLTTGVRLKEGITAPAKIKVLERNNAYTKLLIEIREGKNRQIRRMLSFFDYKVKNLHRIRFGPIKLDNLKSGEYRELTKQEIKTLKRIKDENN